MAAPDRPRRADVEFTAEVRADELTFHDRPEVRVRFPGSGDRESASGSDRHNVPDRVEPATTYRDIRVRYRLATRAVPPDETAPSDADPPGTATPDAPDAVPPDTDPPGAVPPAATGPSHADPSPSARPGAAEGPRSAGASGGPDRPGPSGPSA
ncbi:hypothetical protein [Nocardiopsis trehalosi]|jgi:hypothetical protein|uniref:hypothetical protein n=1 Tax=Nocardiopsis trehalosi TaxID=109329 RepID=UPI000A04C8C5|nr:hypothetical protein [Nocardiopsis trehalosi]